MLQVLSISHHTADAEFRERLDVPEAEQPALLRRLAALAEEVVLLATCNRLEVYSVAAMDVAPALLGFLAGYRGVPLAEVEIHAVVLKGEEAAAHLMSVAAGLDSAVLGEAQILGQVRRAWETSHDVGLTGPTLNTLFRMAVEAGKAVRSQTGIGQGTTSLAHAAVELARQELGSLAERSGVVVGVGEMGRLAAQGLRGRGLAHLTLVNRTLSRAEALARDLEGHAWPVDRLPEALVCTDLVVMCAEARQPVLTADSLSRVMAERVGRPLLVVDLGLPRNVAPEARAVDGVTLYDLDDIQAVCDRNRHARREAAHVAQAHIHDWTTRFLAWQHEREAVSVIRRLREEAETIMHGEVERTLRALPELSEHERLAVEAMSRTLVNRLLHRPTMWLKEHSSEDQLRWLDEMWSLPARPRERGNDRHQS
ncbi:MAG: glutamyl-tRNA reductase [Anaerolineae bacterium]